MTTILNGFVNFEWQEKGYGLNNMCVEFSVIQVIVE